MVKRRLAIAAVLLGVGAVLWFPVLSSLMYAALRMKKALQPVDPWDVPMTAYYLWRDFGDAPAVIRLWKPCMIFATLISFGPAMLPFTVRLQDRLRPSRPGETSPRPVRAASSSHGDARWMTMPQARALFRGCHPAYGGVAIGEAYRVDLDAVARVPFDPKDRETWGNGGHADMLIDDCTADATHGTVEAGSGGFKTTAVTLPTLSTWTGSVVVNDPSRQVGPMAAAMRRDLGHDVRCLSPGADSINALAWIDPADAMAETYILEVVDWLDAAGDDSPKGDNAAFSQGGRKLVACLLADLIYDPDLPAERRTLRELRARITTPEDKMQGRLQDIARESQSAVARDYAQTLMKLYRKTFSGVYFNATGLTDFLAVKAHADMVSDASFDPRALCDGRLTVFFQLPESTMKADPALGRILLGTMRAAVRAAQGNLAGRVLFLLDEARFFGRLEVITDMYTADRKLGVTVVTMWQDHADIKAIWKERASIFGANSSWTLYAAISDQETSEHVSKECGSYTVLARNESTSSGMSSSQGSGSRNSGRNYGTSEQGRRLILPEEVRMMRQDEAIILRRGAPPLRCGRPIYFRRPELEALFEADRLRRAA